MKLSLYFKDLSLQITNAAQKRLATLPGSTSPFLFEEWWGFFYAPQQPDKCKCYETGHTLFRPWPRSEKTRKLHRLQMSLQRQQFLLSYLKTLGPSVSSRSADRRSPN